jgi:hypothetical protein
MREMPVIRRIRQFFEWLVRRFSMRSRSPLQCRTPTKRETDVKVFIGSTCFDLLDIRAELADFLRSIDITPVLSDDKLSDFAVQHDVNSIETCLVNVAACDEVIFILDRRYGPKLGNFGFDDVSATHLEFRTATKRRLPIHFYVRDRLEADYNIYKKNKNKQDLVLSWVEPKDRGLFDFLEERRKLVPNSDTSNWFTQFTSIVDLKASLRHYFDDAFLPERLSEALYSNAFPVMEVTVESDVRSVGDPINIKVVVTNTGTSAALNICFYFDEDPSHARSPHHLLSPGRSMTRLIAGKTHQFIKPYEQPVTIQYDSLLGVRVIEKHKVFVALFPPLQVMCGPKFVSRKFVRGQPPRIELAPSPPE